MARKLRQCLYGVTYYTHSRCIELKPLMKNNTTKELMLTVLRMAQGRYHFELISYSILDNHFNFYIRTLVGGESISRIMQFIKSQFARRYNRIMERTGPFWNERFSDSITELAKNPEKTFLDTIMKICLHPVLNTKNSNPREYPYSSYRCYMDPYYTPPVKITLHQFFIILGDTFEERANRLYGYEASYRQQLSHTYNF